MVVEADAPGITTCAPTQSDFRTSDLLNAAGQSGANITENTPVVFAAAGAGGRGANVWPVNGSPGGLGGLAGRGTTLAHLDQAFGSGTSYCFGIGIAGGHKDTAAGAGGASTILRICKNPDQYDTTRVLLIAGGGGGGTVRGGSGGGGGAAGPKDGGAVGGGSFAARSTLGNIDPSLWGRTSGAGGILIYFQP